MAAALIKLCLGGRCSRIAVATKGACRAVKHCTLERIRCPQVAGYRQLTSETDAPPPQPRHVGDTPFRRTQAQELIVRLTVSERSMLLYELQSYDKNRQADTSQINVSELNTRPSASQLWGVSVHNAIPFIGFGFLDNFIMIVAGDYIDLTIGATLGITTLAAAALGNLISDVAGIGSAWYVESLAAKVGVTIPSLTKEQLGRASTIWSTYLGRAWGVSLGCLLGMVPLLFLHPKKKKAEDTEQEVESNKSETA